MVIRERCNAVSYAEWVAREVDEAEIRVYNRDGSLANAGFSIGRREQARWAEPANAGGQALSPFKLRIPP